MMNRIVGLVALMWIASATWAGAHEIRPGYLQIDQTGFGSYDVLWKLPRIGATVLDIHPRFDGRFSLKEAGGETMLDGFVVYRYRLTGPTDLAGTRLAIRDLPRTTIDVLAVVKLTDGQEHTFLLRPTSNEVVIPRTPTNWAVVATYAKLGIEHILLGADHLLFVMALIILSRGFRKIAWTVSAFTVAHSITLSLAALGYVRVPGPPVEATIALSIVFLAREILRTLDGQETLAGRNPWLVAFAFGLLHGLGFAGALSGIGLPQANIPLALFSFNVGVELGQLAFVAVVLVLIRVLILKPDWPDALRRAPAYAIGVISTFWVVDRLWSFAS